MPIFSPIFKHFQICSNIKKSPTPKTPPINKHPSRKSEKGQAVIESIFSIIITVVMFMLICAISLYMYMQTTVFMAARQGARIAAVDRNMVTSPSSARANVVSTVQNFFSGITGQTLNSGDIVLTGPTGSIGSRNVTVRVTFNMRSPIPAGAFFAGLGAGNDPDDLDTFRCQASATMRFEE